MLFLYFFFPPLQAADGGQGARRRAAVRRDGARLSFVARHGRVPQGPAAQQLGPFDADGMRSVRPARAARGRGDVRSSPQAALQELRRRRGRDEGRESRRGRRSGRSGSGSGRRRNGSGRQGKKEQGCGGRSRRKGARHAVAVRVPVATARAASHVDRG